MLWRDGDRMWHWEYGGRRVLLSSSKVEIEIEFDEWLCSNRRQCLSLFTESEIDILDAIYAAEFQLDLISYLIESGIDEQLAYEKLDEQAKRWYQKHGWMKEAMDFPIVWNPEHLCKLYTHA